MTRTPRSSIGKAAAARKRAPRPAAAATRVLPSAFAPAPEDDSSAVADSAAARPGAASASVRRAGSSGTGRGAVSGAAKDARARRNALLESKYRDYAILAARRLHALRGEDVRVYDLRGVADYTDHVVIATARQGTHARGLGRDVEIALRAAGAPNPVRHGDAGGWLAWDYGDLVVHVQDELSRARYRLDQLWAAAAPVEWKEAAKPAPVSAPASAPSSAAGGRTSVKSAAAKKAPSPARSAAPKKASASAPGKKAAVKATATGGAPGSAARSAPAKPSSAAASKVPPAKKAAKAPVQPAAKPAPKSTPKAPGKSAAKPAAKSAISAPKAKAPATPAVRAAAKKPIVKKAPSRKPAR